jgi:hypothetical protein
VLKLCRTAETFHRDCCRQITCRHLGGSRLPSNPRQSTSFFRTRPPTTTASAVQLSAPSLSVHPTGRATPKALHNPAPRSPRPRANGPRRRPSHPHSPHPAQPTTVGIYAAPTGRTPHTSASTTLRGELRRPHGPHSPHKREHHIAWGATPPPRAALPTQRGQPNSVGTYAAPTGPTPHSGPLTAGRTVNAQRASAPTRMLMNYRAEPAPTHQDCGQTVDNCGAKAAKTVGADARTASTCGDSPDGECLWRFAGRRVPAEIRPTASACAVSTHGSTAARHPAPPDRFQAAAKTARNGT